ncbi:hypothetical protein [Scytonema sp. NUACC26]|uniref:hypothetical protein n=1 Tax=Scytonema sp. NUACC26 TaxID=3140176 RepID=UPI0034DBA566
MTKYQTPSQSFNGSEDMPYNSENFQPEDASDLEARMARLVGLEEESPSSSNENSVPTGQPSLPEPQEPQELQTKQPLSSNPFAKLGVVGAATLALVVVAGTFLTQLMSGTNNKPISQNRNAIPAAPPQPKPESRLEQLERENEALKSKLALTEQVLAVKAAQQQLRNLRPETSRIARANPQLEARDSSREKPRVIVQRIPAPPVVRTVYRDRIVTVNRPVRVPQVVARTNPLPTNVPPVPPPLESSVEFAPPATPDPLQEWARLAKLGSYGQVSTPDNQNTNNSTVASKPTDIPAPQPLTTPRPPVRITPESSTGNLIAQRRTKATKSTVVGSTAKATLVKGLYGAISRGRENTSTSSNEIFVVQLREPLKAEDGSVVIPANAELHTKISSISEGGLVDLNVDKVIWQENGDRIEKPVSPDTLTITGAGGRPPVATQYTGKGGSSFGRDAMVFAFGGAQKAGEIINRPRRKCSYEYLNGGNSGERDYICEDENQDNIAAAIADGGMRSIVPEILRRSQQAQSQRAQRTNIWWMAAGTKMEVRVNRATSF